MAASRPLPGWPRGLDAELAAAYVGLSRSSWESLVKAGDAPAAVWLTAGRKVWLREDLDAWLDKRAGRVNDAGSADAWMTSLAS